MAAGHPHLVPSPWVRINPPNERKLSTLLGPAFSEEARQRQAVNEGSACFQRVYDHLGVLASQLRSLDLQGNVTMGSSIGELMETLLPRLVTTGPADCLWQNYAAIPIKAPSYTAHLWVLAGCQVFDDGSADLAVGYMIGSFDFPQDSPWYLSESFDPGSAVAELKVSDMIAGLDQNLRPAVEAFIERVESQQG